jgi:hypothetical protein
MKNGAVLANHHLVLGVEAAATIGIILTAIFLRRLKKNPA